MQNTSSSRKSPQGFQPEGSALVLVDGANFRRGQVELGAQVDVHQFVAWVAAYGRPTIHWFQGSGPNSAGFFNVLRMAGVRVETKIPKQLPGGRWKADMDIELAIRALDASAGHDTVVLVSGDGDFEPVVSRLVAQGKRVVLLATASSLAPELVQHVEPEDALLLDEVITQIGSHRSRAA